jgi:hypothetical protein
VGDPICAGHHLVAFFRADVRLELLGSGRDMDVSDDQANALWPLVRVVSDSLASLVHSLLTRDPQDNVEE